MSTPVKKQGLFLVHRPPRSDSFLEIANEIQGWIDCDELDTLDIFDLTAEIAGRYAVVVIDYFAIAPFNKHWRWRLDSALAGLRACSRVGIYLHDLHPWTFDPRVAPKVRRKQLVFAAHPEEGLRTFARFCTRWNVTAIISNYDCPELDDLRAALPMVRSFEVLPLHVDTAIFHDYGETKQWDVFIYGTLTEAMYPLRQRLHDLLVGHPTLRVKSIAIDLLHAPRPQEFRNQALSRLINASWLSVACSSTYGYLLLKYFEISASQSVILGDMPPQGRPIWEDNLVEVDAGCTDEQILRTINLALADKERLSRISSALSRKMMTEFNLAAYNRKLAGMVDAIAAGADEA